MADPPTRSADQTRCLEQQTIKQVVVRLIKTMESVAPSGYLRGVYIGYFFTDLCSAVLLSSKVISLLLLIYLFFFLLVCISFVLSLFCFIIIVVINLTVLRVVNITSVSLAITVIYIVTIIAAVIIILNCHLHFQLSLTLSLPLYYYTIVEDIVSPSNLYHFTMS